MASPGRRQASPRRAPGGYPVDPDLGGGTDVQKHLKAHRRSNRFDPDHKFGCLQGRTATTRDHGLMGRSKWRSTDADELSEMWVERPESDEGIVISALDELDENMLQKPELLTKNPVKDGLVEDLCAELEKLCVSSSLHRHPNNPDFAVRVYELPAVGVRTSRDKVKSDVTVQLWSAPAQKLSHILPTRFAELALGPPEEVLEPTLLRRAKLSWKGCADLSEKHSRYRRGQIRPAKAAVRYPTGPRWNHMADLHLDCWVQYVPTSFLEVDLGADCHVTHVSTLGRFPPVAGYPTYELVREWSKEAAGVPAGMKNQWAVVKPESPGWAQWVTKYELQARLQGGRAWETIAVLKGNSDMTAEVAHDLRQVCRNDAGLHCRYLRFLPMAFHGKPAMRIGVYGNGAQEHSEASTKQGHEEHVVRYLIPVPVTNRNRRRHQRDFVSRRAYSPDWYGKYGEEYKIGTRRRGLARDTLLAAREELGRGATLLRRQRSAAYESDAGEEAPGADEGAAEAPERPVAGTPLEEAAVDDDASGARGEDSGDGREPPEGSSSQPSLQRAVSQRVQEAMRDPPALERTRTDDERGYCSEPEELVVDMREWTVL